MCVCVEGRGERELLYGQALYCLSVCLFVRHFFPSRESYKLKNSLTGKDGTVQNIVLHNLYYKFFGLIFYLF